MTGISDVFKSAQNVLRHANLWWLCALNLLPEGVAKWIRLLFPNAVVITQRVTCPQPTTPDTRPTMRLSREGNRVNSTTAGIADPSSPCWSLLLPITSRGQEEAVFWARLENTMSKLGMSVNNTVESACKTTELRVGVDIRDPVLDNDKARRRISAMAAHDAPVLDVVFEEPLPPAFEGKLCWIWGRMAKKAVDAGADYVVLIGDDVELLTPGWQREVEIEFSKISARTGLPLGAACVALRDASFPAFPTFPVVHRFPTNSLTSMEILSFLSSTGALELPALHLQPRCATRWVGLMMHGIVKKILNPFGTAVFCLALWSSCKPILSPMVQ